MKATFLHHEKPLLTTMVQAKTPERAPELITLARQDGTDALGVQFCRFLPEYRDEQTYRRIIEAAGNLPLYATNYRLCVNADAPYEAIADELILLARCGATLCDVMADYYDPQPSGQSNDPAAVARQKELVNALHAEGAEVLLSAHLNNRFHTAEEVIELALQQQERGADIVKLVNKSADMAQQIENIRIAALLKEKLDVPYLYLCGGECSILRRIGGTLGCCMYLCVQQHDELSTSFQPLLRKMRAITDNFN